MNALAFQTRRPGCSATIPAGSAPLLEGFDWSPVERLAYELRDCWQTGRQVFFCGNGGSGGNANHLANDFLYALSKTPGSGPARAFAVGQPVRDHLPRQRRRL